MSLTKNNSQVVKLQNRLLRRALSTPRFFIIRLLEYLVSANSKNELIEDWELLPESQPPFSVCRLIFIRAKGNQWVYTDIYVFIESRKTV